MKKRTQYEPPTRAIAERFRALAPTGLNQMFNQTDINRRYQAAAKDAAQILRLEAKVDPLPTQLTTKIRQRRLEQSACGCATRYTDVKKYGELRLCRRLFSLSQFGKEVILLTCGFLYLVAIMDWSSRKVLAWRMSNTMEAAFCVDTLEEAMERYGKPDIFNSDQGSQFTSFDFTQRLKDAGVRISMDGKGRWLDNVFVERLWRSLKYECVYLHAWSGDRQARDGIGAWMTFYNQQRPHAAHRGRTPDAVYQQPDTMPPAKIAA